MSGFFSFPTSINETTARVVAAGVAVQGALFLVLGSGWFLVPLVYGFVARILTGPTGSPLAQLATRVITPRLPGPHRHVAAPPKRFAQGVGLTFSSAAAVTWMLGAHGPAQLFATGLVAAASLEAVFAVCLGCIVFNRIWGCADCADIGSRLQTASPSH